MLATVNDLSLLHPFPLGIRKVAFDHELLDIFDKVFKEYWRRVSYRRVIIDTDFVLLIPDQTIACYLLSMLRHAVYEGILCRILIVWLQELALIAKYGPHYLLFLALTEYNLLAIL